MADKTSVHKRKIETYKIHVGSEYATICIDEWTWDGGSVGERARHGGEILIRSTFGNYANAWTHCGERFKAFLLHLDFDYFMKKCLSGKHMVFDGGASFKGLCKGLLEYRRDSGINKREARELYDWLHEYEESLTLSEAIFVEKLYNFDGTRDQSSYLLQPWDLIQRKPLPEALHFWEVIWPPFIDALKTEVAAARETVNG